MYTACNRLLEDFYELKHAKQRETPKKGQCQHLSIILKS